MQNAKVRTRQRVKCEMKCENILYFIGDTQSALVTDWFEFFLGIVHYTFVFRLFSIQIACRQEPSKPNAVQNVLLL